MPEKEEKLSQRLMSSTSRVFDLWLKRELLYPKESETLPGLFVTTPGLRAFPSSMRRELRGGA